MLVARDNCIRQLELQLLHRDGAVGGLRMRVKQLEGDLEGSEREREEIRLARDVFYEDLGKASMLVRSRTLERDHAIRRWEDLRAAIRSIPDLTQPDLPRENPGVNAPQDQEETGAIQEPGTLGFRNYVTATAY
jgi:hypothetical protein